MKKKIHQIIHNGQNRGFFSEFFTILSGIKYVYDNDSNFYINWTNNLYSDVNENLFDIFFNQVRHSNEDNFDFTHINFTPYGQHFTSKVLENYRNEKKFHEVLTEFSNLLYYYNIIDSNFLQKIEKNEFLNNKVLGVHIRKTDHSMHGKILDNTYYLSKINYEFKKNSYDKIFVITDDETSLQFLKKELGDLLFHTDSYRMNSGSVGLHLSNIFPKKKLGEDVVRDAYLLSLSTKKILTQSNVSYFAAITNLKDTSYEFIDKHITYL